MSAAEFVTPQRPPSKPTISSKRRDKIPDGDGPTVFAWEPSRGTFLRAASLGPTLGIDFFRAYLIRGRLRRRVCLYPPPI
jgi:hypothetical protein